MASQFSEALKTCASSIWRSGQGEKNEVIDGQRKIWGLLCKNQRQGITNYSSKSAAPKLRSINQQFAEF
jgi:hypothetical protein